MSIFIFLLILNLIIFLNIKYLSKIIPIYDFPDNNRKIHSLKVPKLGGAILFINIIPIIYYLENFQLEQNFVIFFFIIISSFLISLLDDIKDIKPIYRLIIFYIIFFIWTYFDPTMQIPSLKFFELDFKIELGIFTYFLTPLFILIFLNALNLYDGVNGQTITYIMLFFIFFFINNVNHILYFLFIPFTILFFFFNFKNRIFLGDTGVTVFAVLLSFIVISDYNISNNLFCDEIFLIMMVPGVDMLRVYLTRIANKKDPFSSDNSHIHHLIMKKISSKFIFIYQFFLIILSLFLYYYFKLNFYLVVLTILTIYSLTIIYLNDKNTKK